VVVVAAALAALSVPGAALAHSTLESSSPGFRERLARQPAAVVLTFNQKIQPLPGSITVYAESGEVLSGRARATGGGRAVSAPLRTLPRGAYTVRWRVISKGDGHVVSGVYTFGLGVDAPEPTKAYGAAGPTVAEDVVRWLYFVGLALLVGGLGFRLFILRGPVPARLERGVVWVTGIGVVGVLEVGIAAFLLRAHGALQLPLVDFLYGDLSPIAGGTRFGAAFIAMSLAFALVAALLFLSWLLEERRLLWPAFLLGLAFASGLSLSGHQAGEPGSTWLTQLADWVHLSAASLWAGGVVMLAVLWRVAPELRGRAFLGFARLAPVLMGLLLAAGVYMSVLRLPALDDLWTESYGRVLLVKIGLVALALAWGAAHHFLVRPRLDGSSAGSRVGRSLIGEGAVGMAVLLLAAILVNAPPPPQDEGPPSPVAVAGR
jgi:copper transport protein